MVPADVGEDLGVVDQGEDRRLEGQDEDIAVHGPGVERAVDEVIAPALVQVGGQIHELAGSGIGLDVEGGVQDAHVGGAAGGDGGADLVTVSLVVGLLFDDDLDGAGVLSVEIVDQLRHVGGLGVRADPDAGEVDDDLGGSGGRLRGRSLFRSGSGGRGGLLSAGGQGEDHDQGQQQSDGSFHFRSPSFN